MVSWFYCKECSNSYKSNRFCLLLSFLCKLNLSISIIETYILFVHNNFDQQFRVGLAQVTYVYKPCDGSTRRESPTKKLEFSNSRDLASSCPRRLLLKPLLLATRSHYLKAAAEVHCFMISF